MSLSNTEEKLLIVACGWAIAYDNCNPDVGMGPTKSSLVDLISHQCGIQLSEEERERILDKLGE